MPMLDGLMERSVGFDYSSLQAYYCPFRTSVVLERGEHKYGASSHPFGHQRAISFVSFAVAFVYVSLIPHQ